MLTWIKETQSRSLLTSLKAARMDLDDICLEKSVCEEKLNECIRKLDGSSMEMENVAVLPVPD